MQTQRGGSFQQHSQAVLDLLDQGHRLTRSEIASHLGLTRTAISAVLSDLQSDGSIIAIDTRRGTGRGRNAELLAIDPSAVKYIGLDFSHAHIDAVLANNLGEQIASGARQFPASASWKQRCSIGIALIHELASGVPHKLSQLRRIAIGLPGSALWNFDFANAPYPEIFPHPGIYKSHRCGELDRTIAACSILNRVTTDDAPVDATFTVGASASGQTTPLTPGMDSHEIFAGYGTAGYEGGTNPSLAKSSNRYSAETYPVRQAPQYANNSVDDTRQRIAEVFSQEFNVPVTTDHHLRYAAMAEAARQEDAENLLYVRLSSGMGGAIIESGHVAEGASRLAGEIGHMRVDEADGARECRCGKHGCLETFVSIAALETEWQKAGHQGETFDDLCEASQEGTDHSADRIVLKAAKLLGKVLGQTALVTDPHLIVVAGEVGELLLTKRDVIQEIVNTEVLPVQRITILPASVRTKAGALGAVYWCMNATKRGAYMYQAPSVKAQTKKSLNVTFIDEPRVLEQFNTPSHKQRSYV